MIDVLLLAIAITINSAHIVGVGWWCRRYLERLDRRVLGLEVAVGDLEHQLAKITARRADVEMAVNRLVNDVKRLT